MYDDEEPRKMHANTSGGKDESLMPSNRYYQVQFCDILSFQAIKQRFASGSSATRAKGRMKSDGRNT